MVAISATGALSPGPLSIMTLALGVKGSWRSGFQVAVGHTLFEFPYVVLLTALYGNIINFLEMEVVRYSLTAVVVAFNSFFAYLLISDALKGEGVGGNHAVSSGTGEKFSKIKHPLLVGLILTGLNPFFLIWWATVGMPLIEGVVMRGATVALPTMYLSHVWLDFIWLTSLAYTSSKGVKHLNRAGYRALLIFLALVLVVFAVNMLFKTFSGMSIIPF